MFEGRNKTERFGKRKYRGCYFSPCLMRAARFADSLARGAAFSRRVALSARVCSFATVTRMIKCSRIPDLGRIRYPPQYRTSSFLKRRTDDDAALRQFLPAKLYRAAPLPF